MSEEDEKEETSEYRMEGSNTAVGYLYTLFFHDVVIGRTFSEEVAGMWEEKYEPFTWFEM